MVHEFTLNNYKAYIPFYYKKLKCKQIKSKSIIFIVIYPASGPDPTNTIATTREELNGMRGRGKLYSNKKITTILNNKVMCSQ